MTKEPVKLRDYQVADLAFYMRTPRCGNFSDPGTGKTPSVCVYAWWLWTEKGARTIWAMPKSLMHKNAEEMLRFTDFEPGDVQVISGTPKKRHEQMKTDAKVFIMGFDNFAREWPLLVEEHPDIDCLLGDEWHLGFKGPRSKRTASLYRFMERTTYLVAMTGTIIDGRLDAAYSLIHLCEPENYTSGIDGFEVAHAITNSYGQIVAWRNVNRVGEIFGRIAIRHSFEEAYGPEAKVIVPEVCQMDPKQREAYQEFEETALLELENEFVDGSLPGVAQIRARQIMEHPQEFGPPLDKIKLTGKEERLMVHLEDHKNTGKPLVIFGAFQPQHQRLKKICEEMGFRVGLINGQTSGPKRKEIDEAFRNGDIDVIVASAATAGVGFNWGHVDHVVFISLDPMDSNFVQAYRRAVRGERETPLLITMLVYEDCPVEDRILEIVDTKSALANSVDDSKERIYLRRTRREGSKTARKEKPKSMAFKMADLMKED